MKCNCYKLLKPSNTNLFGNIIYKNANATSQHSHCTSVKISKVEQCLGKHSLTLVIFKRNRVA